MQPDSSIILTRCIRQCSQGMDEKIRNQEEKITTSSSLTKQQQGEKNLNILTQKGQQEEIKEEEEEEEEGVEIQRTTIRDKETSKRAIQAI